MSKTETYNFRREDNGEVIEVGFEEMMEQDAAGFIQISTPDGPVEAKRVHRSKTIVRGEIPRFAGEKEIVSDSLGFLRTQLGEFETDRKAHNFTDVEFRPDPDVDGFVQVAFKTKAAWRRYSKHRGMMDISGMGRPCSALSKETMERAKELALQQYPV
jgi:hypothetical protein